jgi:PAS domain S-box-containing protein
LARIGDIMDYSKMKRAQLIEEIEALQAKMTELERAEAERKQAEEELKELLKKIERAKQEWESTADSLPDLVCLVDHQGRIMRANRTVETWNLARVVDVKGQGVHELLHPGCTDSSCYLDSFWKRAWEEASRGQAAQCEAYDEILKRHVLVRVQPWKDWRKGTAFGSTVVIARDITERKQVEEELKQYQLIVESANDALFIKDLQGRYILVNNQVLELFGGIPREQIVGKTDKELMPLEDALHNIRDDQEVFETGEQKDFIKKNTIEGKDYWFNATKIPLRDEKGNIIGLVGIARDITERKRMEEALQESEERYRSLTDDVLDSSAVGIFILDSDFRVVWVNQALERYFGLRRDEIVGKDKRKLIRERIKDTFEDPGSFAENVLATYDDNTYIENFECHVLPDSGREERWLEHWSQPIRSGLHAGGRIEHYTDITERKRAEEALQESKRKLESRERFISGIVESIPSSLLVIDRSQRVVSANRNFLEKSRREAQATLGHNIEEVFPQVLLEYTQLDQKVQEVLHTGQPVEGGKLAYRGPGLPTRIYYYRLIPLRAEEAVENVMLLMDDITEREKLQEEVRRTERHLASVVDSANDLVVSMDAEGRILTWNKAAERTSGFELEEVRGQYLPDLCVEEKQREMTSWLAQWAQGQFTKKSIEINLRTKRGKEVPISWTGSRMLDDEHRIVGLVAVGRDLTERKRLEAQLIQSAKLTSLGVMAGGIAHEIRNPLAISSAAAQLLLERPDDEQLREEAVEKIYSGVQRTSYIIENLLKFARPPEERMVPTDITEALEETLSLLANQLRVQRVKLRKDLAPDLLQVVGNKPLLQQVFSNMILNACNAMPDGGSLTVATRATEAGVEIQFADTGVGIPPDHLSKIFDPFFTTMPVGKGVGLGLSISYSIIQQHQGTIDVASQVGQGTIFTIRLPVSSG